MNQHTQFSTHTASSSIRSGSTAHHLAQLRVAELRHRVCRQTPDISIDCIGHSEHLAHPCYRGPHRVLKCTNSAPRIAHKVLKCAVPVPRIKNTGLICTSSVPRTAHHVLICDQYNKLPTAS
eukprot:3940630-Rhodomonas_salina.1